MAFVTMLLTIFFINILNSNKTEAADLDQVFLKSELKGRNAITLSLRIENVPLEFIYPGVKVDIMAHNSNSVLTVAKNVPVAGVTIMDSETVRLILGLLDGEEELILQNKTDELFIVLIGEKTERNKVEIIEVN